MSQPFYLAFITKRREHLVFNTSFYSELPCFIWFWKLHNLSYKNLLMFKACTPLFQKKQQKRSAQTTDLFFFYFFFNATKAMAKAKAKPAAPALRAMFSFFFLSNSFPSSTFNSLRLSIPLSLRLSCFLKSSMVLF